VPEQSLITAQTAVMAAAEPPAAPAPAAVDSLAAKAASLALDGSSTLPLWFKPELFLEPAFSPTAYVADLRRYVSRPPTERRCRCAALPSSCSLPPHPLCRCRWRR